MIQLLGIIIKKLLGIIIALVSLFLFIRGFCFWFNIADIIVFLSDHFPKMNFSLLIIGPIIGITLECIVLPALFYLGIYLVQSD